MHMGCHSGPLGRIVSDRLHWTDYSSAKWTVVHVDWTTVQLGGLQSISRKIDIAFIKAQQSEELKMNVHNFFNN